MKTQHVSIASFLFQGTDGFQRRHYAVLQAKHLLPPLACESSALELAKRLVSQNAQFPERSPSGRSQRQRLAPRIKAVIKLTNSPSSRVRPGIQVGCAAKEAELCALFQQSATGWLCDATEPCLPKGYRQLRQTPWMMSLLSNCGSPSPNHGSSHVTLNIIAPRLSSRSGHPEVEAHLVLPRIRRAPTDAETSQRKTMASPSPSLHSAGRTLLSCTSTLGQSHEQQSLGAMICDSMTPAVLILQDLLSFAVPMSKHHRNHGFTCVWGSSQAQDVAAVVVAAVVSVVGGRRP